MRARERLRLGACFLFVGTMLAGASAAIGATSNGIVITRENFDSMVVPSGSKTGAVVVQNARFVSDVSFRSLYLQQVDFSGSKFEHNDFREARLQSANLSKTFFDHTDLAGTSFHDCDLRMSPFRATNVAGADFSRSDLRGSSLNVLNAKDARFSYANVADASFLIDGRKLDINNWTRVVGLNHIILVGDDVQDAFTALRDDFRKAGRHADARALTAALRRSSLADAPRIEKWFQKIAFEVPVEYGYAQGRPLWFLLIGILLFWLPYSWSVVRLSAPRTGRGAIWQVWHPDRIIDTNAYLSKPTQLRLPPLKALWYGLYFSILSAFHFGWRDLNVGNWISRIQPREYTLRATGWVRVVSGVQSLISIYLVALWALSYFGRPFE